MYNTYTYKKFIKMDIFIKNMGYKIINKIFVRIIEL